MKFISKTGTDTKRHRRIGNNSNEFAVSESHAWYINNTGGPLFSINIDKFVGDKISWTTANRHHLRVIRMTGGEMLQRELDVGDAWSVDLWTPGTININSNEPGIQVGERIDVYAVNRFQTMLRPEYPNFYTDPFEVAAATTETDFVMTRPGKLSYYNGVWRGHAVRIEVDGKLQRINDNNGGSGGDYKENQIPGTDTFDSITFNTAVGDTERTINVTVDHKGFYDADNISLYQLTNNSSRLTELEYTGMNPINKASAVVTGNVSLGTTAIPNDTSPPLFDEGNAISGLDLSFTPKSTSSKIIIRVHLIIEEGSGSRYIAAALFKDASGTDPAIAATVETSAAANHPLNIGLTHEITNSSLTTIAFKVRAGSHSANTCNLNGSIGVDYGGLISSWLEVEEYLV